MLAFVDILYVSTRENPIKDLLLVHSFSFCNTGAKVTLYFVESGYNYAVGEAFI